MVNRFDWNKKSGPKKLWEELTIKGIAWFRIPNSVHRAETDRYELVEAALGTQVRNVQFFPVQVVKGTKSYQTSNGDALFHTDISPNIQPDLQVMVCNRKSKSGGESRFIDTWKVLTKIRKKDPELYKALFVHDRPIATLHGDTWKPTFSWQNGNFVCSHVPKIHDCDVIGKEFLSWINNEKPIEFLLEPGDMYVANNLRMLHGRNAFSGNQRLYYRLLTDLKGKLNQPEPHGKYAKKISVLKSKILALSNP